jgi:hypothetical protein
LGPQKNYFLGASLNGASSPSDDESRGFIIIIILNYYFGFQFFDIIILTDFSK